MKYCPNCGAPAGDTAFCGQCGKPLTQAAAQTGAGAPGRADQTSVMSQVGPTTDDGAAQGGAAGQSPAAGSGLGLGAAANAFADMPRADIVRDGLALIFLLISFGMQWDFLDRSTGKVYVVLAGLLSIVSLSLPYLKRAGVLPPTWDDARMRLARLAANAPYIVVVLVTLVLDYTNDGTSVGGGVGIGILFGLAGALLAAQPRQAELDGAVGEDRRWRLGALGIWLFAALLSLLSIVFYIVDFGDALEWQGIVLLLLWLAFFLVVPGLPLLGFTQGVAARRDVLVVVGVAGLLAALWQSGADSSVGAAWSARLFGPAHLFWPALAVAVTAPALANAVKTLPGPARWITPAGRLFLLTVLVGGFGVAVAGVRLADDESSRGTAITVLVLQLIVIAAALVGRNALERDPRQGRGLAIVAAGVLLVIGIVQAAVISGSDTYGVTLFDIAAVSVLYAVSISVAVAITAPRVVREEYGPLSVAAPGAGAGAAAGATTAQPGTTQPAATQPATAQPAAARPATAQPAAAPATPARPAYTAQIAADPSTPLEVLADIAATEPSLRPYVAANPSTYPDLLTWLGKLGDPAVDEALRGRGRG